MAVKLEAFFAEISEKAGIPKDNKQLQDLLSALKHDSEALTLPDEIAGKISEELFNYESAKNNSALRQYFTPHILSASDRQINELIESFDDATKQEFAGEKNTPAKIKKLYDKLEAKNNAIIAELKKGSGNTNEKIEKLTKEYNEVHAQLATKDEETAEKVKAAEAKAAADSLNFAKRMALATKQYANDKQPLDLNVEFADLVLLRELQTARATPILKDGTIKLVQLENPDLEYMENHKPVSFGDFSDRTLAKHNMLKVSSPAGKKENAPPITPAEGKELIPEQLRNQIANSYEAQIKTLSNGVN